MSSISPNKNRQHERRTFKNQDWKVNLKKKLDGLGVGEREEREQEDQLVTEDIQGQQTYQM